MDMADIMVTEIAIIDLITMEDVTRSGMIPVTMITGPVDSTDMEIISTISQGGTIFTEQDTGIRFTTIEFNIPVL